MGQGHIPARCRSGARALAALAQALLDFHLSALARALLELELARALLELQQVSRKLRHFGSLLAPATSREVHIHRQNPASSIISGGYCGQAGSLADTARAALSVHIRVAFVYDPYTNFLCGSN